MKSNPALAPLDRALGTWNVTGKHPQLPGRALRGKITFERIEDGAFVRMRSKMEDPELPEGVALFGTDDETGTCTMIYFDVRGISRHYEVELRADGFTWSRDAKKLSQRFHVTFGDDGRTMSGKGTMKENEAAAWTGDLDLDYVRA